MPERTRASYDLATEGIFPPFVLEVVSPPSMTRDRVEKLQAYDLLGAREYALFTPREDGASMLEGYRRGTSGALEPWHVDEQGRLWSEVLELYLVVQGVLVQAMTRDGRVLLSPAQEAERRRQAEEEVERLRQEVDRLRSRGSDGSEVR